VSGPIAIAVLVGLCAGLMELGRRIPPHRREDDAGDRTGERGEARCDELWLFPFGRQPTEPVDAERARTARRY
jgi:hypothetical protein